MRKTIFVLAMVAAACGDDSGDKDTERDSSVSTNDAGRDSGGNNLDSGQQTIDGGGADTGTAGDAGLTPLQTAQLTDGVRGDAARKDLLVGAFCKIAPTCSAMGSMTSEAACLANFDEQWMNLVSNAASDACRDAELDRIACQYGLGCVEDRSPCDKFDAPAESLCADDAGV